MVLWVNKNSKSLFFILGWIFPILACLLPENILPFLFPLVFWSAAAIVISVLYFAAGIGALFDDLWNRLVKKCQD